MTKMMTVNMKRGKLPRIPAVSANHTRPAAAPVIDGSAAVTAAASLFPAANPAELLLGETVMFGEIPIGAILPAAIRHAVNRAAAIRTIAEQPSAVPNPDIADSAAAGCSEEPGVAVSRISALRPLIPPALPYAVNRLIMNRFVRQIFPELPRFFLPATAAADVKPEKNVEKSTQ